MCLHVVVGACVVVVASISETLGKARRRFGSDPILRICTEDLRFFGN